MLRTVISTGAIGRRPVDAIVRVARCSDGRGRRSTQKIAEVIVPGAIVRAMAYAIRR